MRKVVAALSLAFCLALEVGLTSPPVLSGPRRSPGLPPITVPNRGPRQEWAFHPSVPFSGPDANQMRLRVYSSLKNTASGKYLAVQNGVPALGSSQTMEFQFEASPAGDRLFYSQLVAIKSRAGQYLRAAISGGPPVVVMSSIPSCEWVVLGASGARPVPVDAQVALANAVVRQDRYDELVYCPGTPGGLELSWGSLCPPPPSAAEQPVGLARPGPLVPPGLYFAATEFQWTIDAYSPSTGHAVLRNTRINKVLRTFAPNEQPVLINSMTWLWVDQLRDTLSVFLEATGGPARFPYLLYNVQYAIKYRRDDSICAPQPAPCYYYINGTPAGLLMPTVPGYEWVLIPQRQAGSQVQPGQRFALRNTARWDVLIHCPERPHFRTVDLQWAKDCR